MLKRVWFLFVFCFVRALHADGLSDAIYASDIKQVRLLLAEHKPTPTQMLKYLDIAEQVIRTRRMQLDPRILGDVRFTNWHRAALLTLGSTIICGLLRIYYEDKNQIMMNRYEKCTYGSATALLITTLVAMRKDAHDCIDRYENALSVKEILYDSLDPMN